MNCIICLDNIDNPKFLPCLHSFHTKCINKWISEKPYCPICKIPIIINTEDQLIKYNNDKLKMDNYVSKKNTLYHKINELQKKIDNTDEMKEFIKIQDILTDILNFETYFNETYYNTNNIQNTFNQLLNRQVIPIDGELDENSIQLILQNVYNTLNDTTESDSNE